MAVLLLVLITQVASMAEMSAADPKLSSVPIPTNVTIEAYNLNTVVYWDYPVVPQTPVFIVQVKTYDQGTWSTACNTSHHQCDIFSLIDDPINSAWARVKARVGREESAFAESKEFILCRQWKIGPPKLSIRRKEDKVIVDVFHPLSALYEQELEDVYDDHCDTLTYNVYVKVNETLLILKEDDCNGTWCYLTVPVSLLTPEYCVSAEGISEANPWPLKTEKSKELCFSILSHSSIEDSVWIPVVTAFVLFLVLTLVFVCCNIKKMNPFKRKNIMLPKSLVSVVKNASSEAKSESKYLSPITYEPIVPEHEKVIWEGEQWSAATISSTQTEDDPGKAGPKDLSSETEVVITGESTSDVAPGSPLTAVRKADSAHSSSNQSEPCSTALNSYHSRDGSDSGLVQSDSSSSDSELPPNNKTEVSTGEPQPVMLRNTGYDKPHVLVDLPVDEGGKESLIGYRVTAGSKEFS